MLRAYYQATIAEFLKVEEPLILGELTRAHGFALEPQQRNAWIEQVRLLRTSLSDISEGHVLFEFAIPRMGKRADTVIVLPKLVVVVEFKVGAQGFHRADVDQVYDYALDLKNFHNGSHAVAIVPLLCATKSPAESPSGLRWHPDQVAFPLKVGASGLTACLRTLSDLNADGQVDFSSWVRSGYRPTPTIVEAAQALYQQHGVEEITRSDAGAKNLGVTTDAIEKIIEHAKATNSKAICFVTGVPGAGKTLAGLNVATKRTKHHVDEHAVFLSGNGPLVEVLREALARDEVARSRTSKKDAYRRVNSFIQNIHHFRDDALRSETAPVERVVVFDEAQRAWTKEKASQFMQTKRGMSDFKMSEPDFLISVMDRHTDWCVVVCLLGGGQEINTGEAGLSEWLTALDKSYPHWKIYISDRLRDEDYFSQPDAFLHLEVEEVD